MQNCSRGFVPALIKFTYEIMVPHAGLDCEKYRFWMFLGFGRCSIKGQQGGSPVLWRFSVILLGWLVLVLSFLAYLLKLFGLVYNLIFIFQVLNIYSLNLPMKKIGDLMISYF